jgi:hypothetical protein
MEKAKRPELAEKLLGEFVNKAEKRLPNWLENKRKIK